MRKKKRLIQCEREKRRKGKKRNEEMAGRLERGSSILSLVMMGSVQLETTLYTQRYSEENTLHLII
jgi:hypothetical protein